MSHAKAERRKLGDLLGLRGAEGKKIGAQVLLSESMQGKRHLKKQHGRSLLHVREVDTRSMPSVVGFKPSILGL